VVELFLKSRGGKGGRPEDSAGMELSEGLFFSQSCIPSDGPSLFEDKCVVNAEGRLVLEGS
jgi:hypothetical protein